MNIKDNTQNILLILTDQHRFDYLGCTGHPTLLTPHIDALAADSVQFSNAYCAAPVCGPARAAIFTGMYPPASGVLRNHICPSSKRPLLTERLAARGYYCALIGKLHLTPATARHGFDFKRHCDSPHAVYDADEIVDNPYRQWLEKEVFNGDSTKAEQVISASELLPGNDPGFWLGDGWCDDQHHNSTWTGNETVDFIEHWRQEQPLFLNVSFFGPHHPYSTCEPWDSMYDPNSVTLPRTMDMTRDGDPIFERTIARRRRNEPAWTPAMWQRMIACYQGAISQIDREIGRIVAALKAADMYDNTTIIFTADHGDELGDFGFIGKNLMNEGSARIPLLIKPAGADRVETICDRNVNAIDLFATCLELAGQKNWKAPTDEKIESRSMVPLLQGDESTWHSDTYVMDGLNPHTAMALLRRNHLKLVRMAQGEHAAPVYELYDMNNMPADTRNVFTDESVRDQRDAMIASLEAWWTKQLANYPAPAVTRRLTLRDIKGLGA